MGKRFTLFYDLLAAPVFTACSDSGDKDPIWGETNYARSSNRLPNPAGGGSKEVAVVDVLAAFEYYPEQDNNGKPFMPAGPGSQNINPTIRVRTAQHALKGIGPESRMYENGAYVKRRHDADAQVSAERGRVIRSTADTCPSGSSIFPQGAPAQVGLRPATKHKRPDGGLSGESLMGRKLCA